MATFLELAQAARAISGMQGTGPTTVVNAQGIEAVIVRFVRDAYVDIQNMREDFKFLEGSQSFSTQIGQDTYEYLDIFGIVNPSVKKYHYNSFIITDSNGRKSYLQYVERDNLEAVYLNDTYTDTPSYFTEDPSTGHLILKPTPSETLTISFRYQKSPEILTTDAQVPLLPTAFHNLILYKAVEKLSVYLGSPQIYRAYAIDAAKMAAQLMRHELPKMQKMGRRPFA